MVEGLDEALLIKKVRDGDQEAFQQLYERYHGPLFKTVFFGIHDRQLAQDIVQESFLKVWLKRNRLKPALGFFPFVAKVGKNLVQDHFKHERVKTKYHDRVVDFSQKPNPSPDDVLDEDLLRQKIKDAVNSKLAERCRTIFLLSRVQGYSNQEIADVMSIKRKTVENQLYHALKVLKQHCADLL